MRLSKQTLTILRNFANINANILIQQGKKISTIATAKNILAEAMVDEEFPMEFGIFNLPEFLGVIGLMNEPEFQFDDKKSFMMIKEGNSKVRYTYASKDILTYPTRELKFPPVDVKFTLGSEQLAQLQKAAGTLGVQDLAVVGDGKNIVINLLDKKNSSSNEYTMDMESPTSKSFTAYFKIDNFKQIADDYTVEISEKNISRFTGVNSKVTYLISMEPDSKF